MLRFSPRPEKQYGPLKARAINMLPDSALAFVLSWAWQRNTTTYVWTKATIVHRKFGHLSPTIRNIKTHHSIYRVHFICLEVFTIKTVVVPNHDKSLNDIFLEALPYRFDRSVRTYFQHDSQFQQSRDGEWMQRSFDLSSRFIGCQPHFCLRVFTR